MLLAPNGLLDLRPHFTELAVQLGRIGCQEALWSVKQMSNNKKMMCAKMQPC
jgi:hypothetical protein